MGPLAAAIARKAWFRSFGKGGEEEDEDEDDLRYSTAFPSFLLSHIFVQARSHHAKRYDGGGERHFGS